MAVSDARVLKASSALRDAGAASTRLRLPLWIAGIDDRIPLPDRLS